MIHRRAFTRASANLVGLSRLIWERQRQNTVEQSLTRPLQITNTYSQGLNQLDVFLELVVGITRDVPIVTLIDEVGVEMSDVIPNVFSLTCKIKRLQGTFCVWTGEGRSGRISFLSYRFNEWTRRAGERGAAGPRAETTLT